MTVLTAREQTLVGALIEAAVADPAGAGELPAVSETDAIPAFDAWLAAAPRPNRAAMRALLATLGVRLRRLPPAERAGFLRTPRGRLAPGVRMLMRIAAHCYYGDARVMRRLGYDADAVARRGAQLRAAEGRL